MWIRRELGRATDGDLDLNAHRLSGSAVERRVRERPALADRVSLISRWLRWSRSAKEPTSTGPIRRGVRHRARRYGTSPGLPRESTNAGRTARTAADISHPRRKRRNRLLSRITSLADQQSGMQVIHRRRRAGSARSAALPRESRPLQLAMMGSSRRLIAEPIPATKVRAAFQPRAVDSSRITAGGATSTSWLLSGHHRRGRTRLMPPFPFKRPGRHRASACSTRGHAIETAFLLARSIAPEKSTTNLLEPDDRPWRQPRDGT